MQRVVKPVPIQTIGKFRFFLRDVKAVCGFLSVLSQIISIFNSIWCKYCFFSQKSVSLANGTAMSVSLFENRNNYRTMASRKNLKKVITFVVDDLATEAFLLSYDAKGDTEAWVNVFNKIFALNNEYIARVNHVEPGMPAKKYFNALCDSFNKDARAILAEIGELSK